MIRPLENIIIWGGNVKKAFIFVVVFVAICAGSIYWVYNSYLNAIEKPLKEEKKIEVTVEKGDSLYSLLDRLYSEKKIKNPLFFKLNIRANGLNTGIQPGKHTIEGNENFPQMLKKLQESPKEETIRFTVIEGMNIEQIAEKLDEEGICTKDEFIEAVQSYPLPEYIKKVDGVKYALEGFLYPDTYEFYKDIKPTGIIEALNKRFDQVLNEVQRESGAMIEDIYDLTILASIVEKEAVVEGDRRKIASVYTNRMKIDMPLQSCPTVIYSIGNQFYDRDSLVVLNKDLEVESPYNTYKQKGLPPGPIGAPRKESLLAAMNPEETNYLYFIARDDGTHFFTNNYNEFINEKLRIQSK